MTDDQLEQEFRAGLRRAAEHAEVGVPLAERAHAGAQARRRRRWALVGTVTAVVAVAGVTAVVQRGDEPDSSSRHTASQPSFAPVTEWRAESWRGLTVDVPADWGWGTAPIKFHDPNISDTNAYFCGGPGAEVAVGGGRSTEPKKDTPWVGRPIMLSDACGAQQDPEPPSAPYIWLGADVDPGTVDLGAGWTQETVEAFGSTLSVASQDPAFRKHVLDSARGTTGCGTQLAERPGLGPIPVEGLDPIHSAQLCAYQRNSATDPFDLVYATTLDQATAQALYSGKGLVGQKAAPDFCDSPSYSFVVLTFSGKDRMGTAELTTEAVIDPGCRQIRTGGLVLPLTDAGMDAWSRNGLKAVLGALIGPMG
jgi:hypothetical protein